MTARARPRAVAPSIDELLADGRITALGLLTEVLGGLQHRLNAQFAEHGLAAAEFEVLLRIARTPGQALRMNDLAAQTQLTTSGITRVVDRLERDRLVERRACPTDRRGAFAGITEAGLARLEAALPGHIELIEKWFTGRLIPADLEGLQTSLRTLRDGVRPDATAGADGSPA